MLFCKGQESKKQEVEEEVNKRSAFVDSLVNPSESPNEIWGFFGYMGILT
jgi:hypothetical protein